MYSSKNNNLYKVYSNSENDVACAIESLGDSVLDIIYEYHPKYIIPLESKGAIILELALEKNRRALPSDCLVVYRRALDFLSKEEIGKEKCLVVDDMFFTGRTMRKAYEILSDRGAKDIKLLTLFDFSYLNRDSDVDQDIYIRTLIPNLPTDFSFVSHVDILAYIQGRILSERMPATYDHLMFEANVPLKKYHTLLEDIGETNRLLHYGQRGAYQTSSILLDDLVEGKWSTPPKIRLWYNESKNSLRIAPIGFPAKTFEPPYTTFHKKLEKIIISKQDSAKYVDQITTISLSQRLSLFQFLVPFLKTSEINCAIEEKHLRRYYPGKVGEKLISFLKEECDNLPSLTLPKRGKTKEPIEFFSAITPIIQTLREAYEIQAADGMPKHGWEERGYTVSELITKFKDKYTPEQIHSAIDYCFDNIMITAFYRDETNSLPERAVRTTENGYHLKYLPAESFGAGILFSSQMAKTPVWIPNKVYSILEKGLGAKLETLMAVKHYHGDYTKIEISENVREMWSTFQRPLWSIERSPDEGDEQGVYLIPDESKKDEARRLIVSDPRLKPHQSMMDAIHHLCREGGYKSAVLLDILCDRYGGTTYLAYNLEHIIQKGVPAFCYGVKEAREEFSQHCRGLETKLQSIENGDNYLARLRRRATRLWYQSRIIAEEFLQRSIPLSQPNAIYLMVNTLFSKFKTIYSRIEANDYSGAADIYKDLGLDFKDELDSSDPVRLLCVGNDRIIKWAYAISGVPRKDVSSDILQCDGKQYLWVLAYDLTKARKDLADKLDIDLSRVNWMWHGLIENWIIAHRGKLSNAAANKGDHRYGFFFNEEDAINAAFWIDYHSNALNGVNPVFSVPKSFTGIGIGRGPIESDGRGGVQGEILDKLGHQLKEEKDYRDLIDILADEIAARGERPPIWIVNPKLFPYAQTRNLIGPERDLKGELIAPLRNSLTYNSLPWC